MTEREAHDELLRRCRASGPGRLVMREWGGLCRIESLSRPVGNVIKATTWGGCLDLVNELDEPDMFKETL